MFPLINLITKLIKASKIESGEEARLALFTGHQPQWVKNMVGKGKSYYLGLIALCLSSK
jgi:hypothetical protein